MHVLLAADADWLIDDIVAALGGSNTSFTVCRQGGDVAKVLADRHERNEPVDIGIFDLQIGNMGGMAVTMDLRLDASSGATPEVPVLMLLDRVADVHLARRSGADGWLIKPLDPLRLRRAVRAVIAGTGFTDGHGSLPAPPSDPAEDTPDDAVDDDAEAVDGEPAGTEPATAG